MTVHTRRALLGGMLATAATPALAAIGASPRPLARPPRGVPVPVDAAAADLVAEAALGGQIGYVVAEAASGKLIDGQDMDLPLPPASVAKAITAAYALETLGPAYRFRTRLIGTGPLRHGRLDGDLILVGGGAPGLSTDHLAMMAEAAREAGLVEVTGRFLVWTGALPDIPEIDPRQPAQVGYNPAISGLNLNFNRVHFEWRQRGAEYDLSMDARTQQYKPAVSRIRASLADRRLPVFRYLEDPETGSEEWSVAESALGGGGTRWLPVRHPGLYAGDVMRTLMRANGVVLREAELTDAPPPATPVLAEVSSAELEPVARGMMRFSTNLTAEVLGLTASKARTGVNPVSLAASADEMSAWAGEALGMGHSQFMDHSGLNDLSRVTARDMSRALVATGPNGMLRKVMRRIDLPLADGRRETFRIDAKTGTLNFVSALSGYIGRDNAPDLVFAIFTAQPERRAAIPPGDEENPPGASGWNRRSRRLQYELVRLWGRHAAV
ncbi:MAG: D-alanyl-D-alanine carboxypeptidase/D-alanyl-D-alanine-endopeptidase [Pseudomonadota bacterium]